MQPAPDRRRRRLGHAALDDQGVQLNAREARQRQIVAARQLAGDRLDLGDLVRGENGAGDPTALDPQDLPCAPRRTGLVVARRCPVSSPTERRYRCPASLGGIEDHARALHDPEGQRDRRRAPLKLRALLVADLDHMPAGPGHDLCSPCPDHLLHISRRTCGTGPLVSSRRRAFRSPAAEFGGEGSGRARRRPSVTHRRHERLAGQHLLAKLGLADLGGQVAGEVDRQVAALTEPGRQRLSQLPGSVRDSGVGSPLVTSTVAHMEPDHASAPATDRAVPAQDALVQGQQSSLAVPAGGGPRASAPRPAGRACYLRSGSP